MSVRITAAGAVLVAVSFLTAPARACDDRFIKKCETVAAVAAAEEVAAEPARRTSRRVKAVRQAPSRLAVRSQPPRFAVRNARGYVLASDAERASAERTPAELPLARRFRGFIDAQPIAQNAFEALRKPQAAAHDFDGAAILPQAEAMAAELAATAVPAAKPATIATTKQDRLVNPAAIELASAQSRQVALAALAPAAPAVLAALAPAAPAVLAAPAIVTEAPAERQPSPFSIHGLVLALCGALGAASALRFIVSA